MESDIKRIESWAKIFDSPVELVTKLFTNVVSNFSDIADEATKAAREFETADYYHSGDDLAEIMVLSLGPVPAAVELETLELTQW